MTLSIKNQRCEDLASELASRTGESITEAVTKALRARLDSVDAFDSAETDAPARQRLERLLAEFDALPDLDTRTPDEILGYDG